MIEVISDIMKYMRLSGCVYFQRDFCAPWAMLHLIMDELTHREPGHELSVERLAEVLLMQVSRVHYRAQGHPEGFFAGLRDKRLNRAITRIHSDFSGPLTPADLAESAAMSRTAFARRFSSVVRMTPVDYLQHRRMLVAQDLLPSTDRSLSDIAEDVGYGSDIAFSRAYKRRFGMSPSAARYSP